MLIDFTQPWTFLYQHYAPLIRRLTTRHKINNKFSSAHFISPGVDRY